MVIETSQAGAIVVGDEGVEVGIAFLVVAKAAVVGDAVFAARGRDARRGGG
jgi:hypothetical protein